jgi:zinc transporter ZupT
VCVCTYTCVCVCVRVGLGGWVGGWVGVYIYKSINGFAALLRTTLDSHQNL